MTIISSPIDRYGNIKYIELFKIIAGLMIFILSFTYAATMSRVFLLIPIYTSIIGSIGVLLYATYQDLVVILDILKSHIIPWLKQQIHQTWNSSLDILSYQRYIHLTINKESTSKYCVMRC